ncbi:hypothetical protein JXA02_10765, partial [candidate division KSB1 bacterium]|nr:hypothetical protein [candidate division KSB1 bacterium]
INGQDDFDAFLREHADLRHIFYDLMTAQRISFSNARPEEWAALNPLYDGMRDFLATHPNKENVYIITTKKLLFVHLILDAHDVQLIDANIHGTSVNRTKRHIIQDILQDRGAQAARFYFLDDQVDTLIKVKPTGVQTILAGWGYNDAGQRALAAKEDIPVFTLRQFYATFEST